MCGVQYRAKKVFNPIIDAESAHVIGLTRFSPILVNTTYIVLIFELKKRINPYLHKIPSGLKIFLNFRFIFTNPPGNKYYLDIYTFMKIIFFF